MIKPILQPNLAVIIPVFNEEASLLATVEDLAKHLDDIVGKSLWIYVIVDNGSQDETPKISREIVRRWPKSKYLRLDKPNYGEALSTGLKKASTAFTYIINVDFWDPVFLNWSWCHRDRYDLIIGSKRSDFTLNQQSRFRIILSWGLNTILQLIFGFVGTDTHGQKFLKMETMREILEVTKMRRGQFDTEFTLRALRKGLWLAEVPVPIKETRGPRNLMVQKIVRNLIDIVRLRKIIQKFPKMHSPRYHRWARQDMLDIYKGIHQKTEKIK